MKRELIESLGPGLMEQPEESVALLFHENTKLSQSAAVRLSQQFSISHTDLFLSNRGYRQYRTCNQTVLPEPNARELPLNSAMKTRRSHRDLSKAIRLETLGTLLGQSVGINYLASSEQQKEPQALRAWPSAGALYPLDTYVLVRNVTDLEAGVYHYNVLNHALERLRTRPVEDVMREGFFHQDWIIEAAMVVVLAASFERTMAKYGDRGYRMVLLDAGHAGQNLLLTAEQEALGACAIGGFCDDLLARDLELDGIYESAIYAVAVGMRQTKGPINE